MPDNILWIFLHLQKTGGTTFNAHLKKHMIWDEEVIHLGGWGDNYRREHNKIQFYSRSRKRRKKVKVICGHRAYYGIHEWVPNKIPRYITFIREPASAMISRYNFQFRDGDKNKLDFDDFLKSQINHYCDFYFWRSGAILYFLKKLRPFFNNVVDPKHRFKKAKKVLDKCWHVGITENLDNDLKFLFSELDLPTSWKNYRVSGDKNSSVKDIRSDAETFVPKKLELTEAIKESFYQKNPWDVKLYEYAVENLSGG